MTPLQSEAFGDAVMMMKVRSALDGRLPDQDLEMIEARLVVAGTEALAGRNEIPGKNEMARVLCLELLLQI